MSERALTDLAAWMAGLAQIPRVWSLPDARKLSRILTPWRACSGKR